MTARLTSIRLDAELADEAVRVLGVKSRTDAVHVALRELVGNQHYKDAIKESEGKLEFAGSDE